MRRERVEFPCDDIMLEGVLAFPEGPGPFGVVIMCHPHPLYGGNMDNTVVHVVCDAVLQEGLAALRFNFRGVGKSGGRYADGVGERADVKAAVSFVEKRSEIDPERVGLCGYSFGSMVAFPAAVEDSRIKAVAGISPFVQPPGLLNNYTRPKLFLTGDMDEYVNDEELKNLVSMMPPPKQMEIVPGADHFWWGAEDEIAEVTGGFFSRSV